MKSKELEFPLDVLKEKLFYLNHKIEVFKNDEFMVKGLTNSIKELEFAIKLIELQIEYNKIN
jgi:hypothetical protein